MTMVSPSFEAAIHHQILIDSGTRHHRAHLHRAVLLDDVHELAVLTGLHRLDSEPLARCAGW